ncbi:MAG: class II aldolase/adducin family protein, partial [Reyranella sp.]|nr:class II aldolase/adducin family protein [Reyranella sp.]
MDTVVQSDKLEMTEAEWQARCDLAALYRVTDHFGWTDTIDTHMTVRIPGEPKCFLINNYGDLFHEITASSLVKMDLDGNVYGKDGRFNAAGFTIHSGVYKARPDANCVLHTHTRAGTGVSVLKKGLRPISQDVLSVWDDLVYHEYGMPTSQEECDSLGVTCQNGNSVVLRNHGLLTVGAS